MILSCAALCPGIRPDTSQFLVGDVKQSIYAFGWRPAYFFSINDKGVEYNRTTGQVLPLTDNFRSHERS